MISDIRNTTEIVEYTTAVKLAAEYKAAVESLKQINADLLATRQRLADAFDVERSGYDFDVSLHYRGRGESIEQVLKSMKLAAWRAILDRLKIRSVMSSKRVRELDSALSGDPADAFPEIDPDNIEDVARGYVMSAIDFLEEAVAEEYEFWRPNLHVRNERYVRNDGSEFALQAKIIKGWMVERCNWGNTKWRPRYGNESHIRALDNIFHMLDDKGPLTTYMGELGAAISNSDGTGETDYFKFKCFQNGNLHLWIRRNDLLDKFNQIAGRNRLKQPKGCKP